MFDIVSRPNFNVEYDGAVYSLQYYIYSFIFSTASMIHISCQFPHLYGMELTVGITTAPIIGNVGILNPLSRRMI